MSFYGFKGGVHPKEHKDLTREIPVREAGIPPTVTILCRQHIGSPAQPVVSKGDPVSTGQLIAEAQGYISTNIHSSATGTVTGISSITDAAGAVSPAITIKTEQQDTFSYSMPKTLIDIKNQSKDELINTLFDCGIVGLGGACFPTHVKLSPPAGKPIDTLIINGAECEPYLTCDYRLMLERGDQLIKGISVIQRLLGTEHCIIGIERNKTDAAQTLQKIIDMTRPDIDIQLLKVKYPQGGEKQLIKALTNRKVPPGKLPLDVGCVVHNIGTCLAVYEAVFLNKPLYERVVTISGSGIKDPANLNVRVGTPASFLIDACGGLKNETTRFIFGGPMMGQTQTIDNAFITKGTSGILVLPADDYPSDYMQCVRCGRCVNVCVARIPTARICMAAEFGNYSEAEALHVADCIECGCCAYVCPAKRPLVQFIKTAKNAINRINQAKKKEKAASAS